MQLALYRRRARERRGHRGARLAPLRTALGVVLVGVVVGVGLVVVPTVAAVSAYTAVMASLPGLVEQSHQATFQTTKIFDRQGRLLYEVYDPQAGLRTVVPLAEVPKTLIAATIATEDANFYTNPGFDLVGIARAAYQNYTGHRIVAGGSTITQQLIKRVFLTPEPSLRRKVQEVALAYALSQQYSKDQILELYLNEIYYGNLAYGIEAAAEAYFGKSARALDLAEAAMLAGLPQSPSEYDPLLHRERAKRRQQEVLRLMAQDGYITGQQAAEAAQEELHFQRHQVNIRAPHFVMYVREYLEQKYGPKLLYEGGLNVTTSLDLAWQEQAQGLVARHVAALAGRHQVHNGALVALRPETGEVLAMVGSADYDNDAIDGKYNVATGLRQPGSALKPFVYYAALAKGWTAVTPIEDSPAGVEFPNGDGSYYRPQNYDGKFHGRVTLRAALANSLNLPAVRALKYVGVGAAVEVARAAGVTTLGEGERYGLALVLGGAEVRLLELTGAYGVLAAGGKRVPVNPILKIEDSRGRVLEELQPPVGEQVLSPQVSYILTSILSDDVARGLEFGRHSVLELPRPAAVKTGTTNDFRDNWTVGYVPGLVVGVWVGNSDNTPMKDIIGIDGAGPIWHDFMVEVLKGVPVEPFVVPEGLVKVPMSRAEGTYTEYFLKGTEPGRGHSNYTPSYTYDTPSTGWSTSAYPRPTTPAVEPAATVAPELSSSAATPAAPAAQPVASTPQPGAPPAVSAGTNLPANPSSATPSAAGALTSGATGAAPTPAVAPTGQSVSNAANQPSVAPAGASPATQPVRPSAPPPPPAPPPTRPPAPPPPTRR